MELPLSHPSTSSRVEDFDIISLASSMPMDSITESGTLTINCRGLNRNLSSGLRQSKVWMNSVALSDKGIDISLSINSDRQKGYMAVSSVFAKGKISLNAMLNAQFSVTSQSLTPHIIDSFRTSFVILIVNLIVFIFFVSCF